MDEYYHRVQLARNVYTGVVCSHTGLLAGCHSPPFISQECVYALVCACVCECVYEFKKTDQLSFTSIQFTRALIKQTSCSPFLPQLPLNKDCVILSDYH